MPDPIVLRDTVTDMRVFSARLVAAALVVLVLTAVLVSRYFYLQISQHEQFRTQSDNNRIHLRPVAPKRGLIYARDGELLAENLPTYTLTLTPERSGEIDEVLNQLRSILAISETEEQRFRERLRRHRPFESLPLHYNLDEQERSVIAVNRHRLPGVEVEARLLRKYAYGELFAHSLGYVGRISERDLKSIDPVQYAATDHIGKSGVEKVYEAVLHGVVGSEQVETDARGRVLRVLERSDPEPGGEIVLSLDVRTQKAAAQALAGWRGSVVAIEPSTGLIRAIVSTPSYDPNPFVTGISSANYALLRDSVDQPLFNRSLQGQYPPGSTLKPIFALAGLVNGVVDENTVVPDPGWYRLPGDDRNYRDWKKGGHGRLVDLHQAIVESCDIYFYDLAHRLGIDHLHDFSLHFGLGKRTGIDQIAERAGLMPSTEWKKQARKMVWFPGETLSAGIGQGYVLATPLQLAVMTATLANRGLRVKPRVVYSINGEPKPVETVDQVQGVSEEQWQAVAAAMTDVVHGARGTARASGTGASYRIAGKTGTAQVVGIAQDEEYDAEKLEERQRDHALFIAYAPAETPQIAVAVLVENGEHGSSAAAPVARRVIDAYLARSPVYSERELTQ